MEISKFLKFTFLIHFLIALSMGLIFFLVPEMAMSALGFTPEPFANRTVGALFIAFAIGSLLGYRAESWERVEIVVLMDIIWLLFGLIAIVWSMVTITMPTTALAFVGLFVFLLLIFGYSFYEVKYKT